MKALRLFAIILIALSLSLCSREKHTGESKPDFPVLPFAVSEPLNTLNKEEVLFLTFMGDIMAHDVNYTRPPYSNIYEGVKDIFLSDDFTFGNLEFPVDPDKPMSNYPCFNVHPSYVKAAIDAGVDVFSLANNHITDQGKESVLKTLAVMEHFAQTREIYFSGIRHNIEKEFIPETINYREWEIGFLAVTDILNNYNEKEQVYYVNCTDLNIRNKFIETIKRISGDFDFFILSYHGGIEYRQTPADYKTELFYELINAGADIIWSHHPHVLQPFEEVVVNGKRRLIIFSNGNFISGQTWNLDPASPDINRVATGESALFRVQIVKYKGDVSVLKTEAVPIANYKNPDKGMVVQLVKELLSADIPDKWKDFYKSRLELQF